MLPLIVSSHACPYLRFLLQNQYNKGDWNFICGGEILTLKKSVGLFLRHMSWNADSLVSRPKKGNHLWHALSKNAKNLPVPASQIWLFAGFLVFCDCELIIFGLQSIITIFILTINHMGTCLQLYIAVEHSFVLVLLPQLHCFGSHVTTLIWTISRCSCFQ